MNSAWEIEVNKAEERLRKAMIASDVDELNELLSPSLVFTNHLGQVMSKFDDIEGHKAGDLKIDNILLSEQLTKCIDELVLVSAYAEISGNDCPDFKTWSEEFYWLVGLMDGLQAVLNDLASEGSANVPLGISLKVGRRANCLDNEKWWGVPNAIQAAIWVSFPGNKPEGIDPLEVLELSVKTGLKQGMRIVQVIAAKIYIGLGDTERVKAIIRDNVETRSSISANLNYLFLDKVATIQLLAISDTMWTEVTGTRTPIGGLGSFWNDPEDTVDTVDIIDIL